jgi:hypothetical protein
MTDKHFDMTPGNEVDGMEDTATETAPRPVTYHQASSRERGIVDAQERYEALTDRKMSATTVAILRERGEFDPANPAHASMAERGPLTADDYLEMMAAGEVLARYYRHPTMLDHAAKAGATWEQIGDARGTGAEEARREYRKWADGQRHLAEYYDGRFGMSDAEHAEAMQRLGEPASAGEREAGQ